MILRLLADRALVRSDPQRMDRILDEPVTQVRNAIGFHGFDHVPTLRHHDNDPDLEERAIGDDHKEHVNRLIETYASEEIDYRHDPLVSGYHV